MRRHQSTSSLNMKNASSMPPTSSMAPRLASMQAPDTQSTSRTDAWSQSVIRYRRDQRLPGNSRVSSE